MKLGFKWTPTKELTITPNIISQKVKTGDTDVSYTQVLLDAQPTGVNLPNYQTSKLTHEPGSDALTVPSLTINYSTQYGDLTSVTSFFKRDFTRVQDGQYTNSYQMAAYYLAPASVDPVTGATTLTPLANTIQGLPSAVTLENYVTQLSQEVRFASKPYQEGGSPYTWIVGGYLSNGFTDVHENDYVYGIRNAFTVNGQNPTTYPGVWNTPATPGINCTNNTVVCINSPAGVAEGFPADNTWHGDFSYHDMQQSIFGESSYYFEPTLHATVGVRYLHASQLHNSYQDLFYQGDAPTYTHNDTISGDKVTPKFAVVWETSPTNSVFATAAEGFRLGGANSAVPYQLCQLPGPNPLTYASDSLWSYEVGDKARFLNNTVTLNASAFYIKWKNMQQEIELSCSFDYNVNVGSATIYGGEFELKFKPVPSFVIDAAGGMTHATLDSSEAADSPASQGTLSGAVAGAWVPGVPNYNLALTATYSFDYNDDYFGFLRGGVHFIGSSYGGFDTLPNGAANPDYTRPAYHTVDVSTGVSWKEWEATLFVKNLTNNNMVIQKPIEQAQESGEVYRIPPRQIGVSLSAKF